MKLWAEQILLTDSLPKLKKNKWKISRQPLNKKDKKKFWLYDVLSEIVQ